MKESYLLQFLYRTVPGRAVLKLLTCRTVSKAAGRFLSSGLSKGLVPFYIRKHGIDLEGIEVPRGGFSSFNEFFTRKRKPESGGELSGGELVYSPCDGFLSCIRAEKDRMFSVKHSAFSLEELLKDEKLAESFRDGTALIFRLTPADYHRYSYAVSGKVVRQRRISGKLHCVRPVALEAVPVFVQNSREYQVIRTEKHGLVVQMEIGALLVGRIRNLRRYSRAARVRAGEEKGYFEFGGSTILLLFQKDALRWKEELLKQKDENGETPVQKGEPVAE